MKVIGPFSPPHHSSFLLGACASHPYHPHVWGEWSFFSDKANSCNIEALLSAGDLVLVWLCFNSWSLLSDFLKRHYLFLTCSILCLLDLWNFSLVPGFETVTLFFFNPGMCSSACVFIFYAACYISHLQVTRMTGLFVSFGKKHQYDLHVAGEEWGLALENWASVTRGCER